MWQWKQREATEHRVGGIGTREQALPGVAGLGKRCSVPIGEASYGVGRWQESDGWAVPRSCGEAKLVGGLEVRRWYVRSRSLGG